MDSPPPPAGPARATDGRPFGWRLRTAGFGVVFAGAAIGVIVWPWLLAWFVGGMLGAIGLFLLVSAVAAKGR